MLLKCHTQYASKCGKLSSSHRTAKGQFSFQFQRRAVSKNIQNTAQVHSFHVLERLCSKFFNLGFSSMWTKNFQMYKLSLEKAKEAEIKLSAFIGHRESKEIPEKYLLLFHWLQSRLWLCGSQQTVENSQREGNTRSPYLSPEKSVCGSQINLNITWNNWLF